MTFKDYGLSEEILQAVEMMKYTEPTEVQRSVIPLALEKIDVVVKSQTGSGKTASFGIPVCNMIQWEENKPQVLVLTPTRELAVQVKEDLMNIGRLKRVKATALFGKQPMVQQERELKQKTHIVVGTPGRILDHLDRETLDLEKVKYLIIDEADEMLNRGFIEQVEAIIEATPSDRVTMLFSATLPNDVQELSEKYMDEPVHIEIENQAPTTENIEHVLYTVKEEDKMNVLKDVLTIENPESCIIFCRTKEQVDTVFAALAELEYPCERMHGGMLQEERLSAMKDFKLGKFRYLIATDVAARGIDIHNISLILNYDVPMEKESYVHRTGRTGRAGNKGKAVTFATPFEEKFVNSIQRYIGFEIPKRELPSTEQVERRSEDFQQRISQRPKMKKDMNAVVGKDIMKLYFGGGKKKKLRAFDFVGTLSNLDGISADDIGIIDVQDNVTYIDILNGKGALVMESMQDKTVKGKKLKVQRAKK